VELITRIKRKVNFGKGKDRNKREQATFLFTEDVTGRTIALPFFSNLKEEQIEYVVEKLKEAIERNS